MLGQRLDDALEAVALRMLTTHQLRKHADFGVRIGDRRAGLQPANHRHRVAPAIGLRAEREWKVEVEAAARREDGREVERRREHAHHRVRRVVDDERRADDRGIAVEAALPQSVAEHHGLGAVPGALLGIERAAEQGLHAEHVEEVLRHGHAAQPLGLASAAQEIVTHAVEGEVAGNGRQRLGSLSQVQQVAHLRRLAGEVGEVAIGNPHQLGGLLEGERPQEQRVDDAEDGGAGANAEPRDQDGKDGKAGIAAHAAKGVADILEEVREDHGGS